MGVLCPKCQKPGKVLETRRHGPIVHRRRQCCGQRWNTYEGGDTDEIQRLIMKTNHYRKTIADIRAALGGTLDQDNGNQ